MAHEEKLKSLFLAIEDVVIGHRTATQKMADDLETNPPVAAKKDMEASQIKSRFALLEKYVTAEVRGRNVVLTLDLMGQPATWAPHNTSQDLVSEIEEALKAVHIEGVRVTEQHRKYADYNNAEKRDTIYSKNPNYEGTTNPTIAGAEDSRAASNSPKLEVTLPDTEESVAQMERAFSNLVHNLAQTTIYAAGKEANAMLNRLIPFGIAR